MSTTYTASIKLGQPASGDRTWNVPLNANAAALDVLSPVGDLAVTTHEQPSSTLTVDIAAGQFLDQSGAVQTYAGVSGQAITASVTRALYLDGTASWALVTSATSYPSTPHVRLATVVTGSSTISSVTDTRIAFTVVGSIADGTGWALGTSTGLKIGTATTQKLGFYNATPIVQPANTTDLRTLLINLGLLASGGANPLNLNGGALTVGSATIADAGNVAVGTTTGTKIGTATNQKLGFFNATPVVQPTAAGQGAVTDSTGSSATTTLPAVRNDTLAHCASDAADGIHVLFTLVDAIRTALVNTGVMKGS
jgi:hypothetical protein